MFKQNPQKLRKASTESEKKLWWFLRRKQLGGFKFRRQQPIGPYIVDFVCFEKKVGIELDGSIHNYQKDYDDVRTVWLKSQGFCVLRFWNRQVMDEPCTVIDVINRTLGI